MTVWHALSRWAISGPVALELGFPSVGGMTRLSHLTLRNFLIALTTCWRPTLALFASFYLRFEGGDCFFDRLPLLFQILPYFLAFSVVVLLRLQPDHDEMALHLAARRAEHPARRDRAGAGAAGARLCIFVAPNVHGAFFFGKVTIVLYWFLQMFFLSALRSPIAISATRACGAMPAPKTRRRRCCSAAPRMPRCCCAASRAARSSSSGRSACCRRRPPTAASRSAAFRCSAASTISRTCSRLRATRKADHAAGADASRRSSRRRIPNRS